MDQVINISTYPAEVQNRSFLDFSRWPLISQVIASQSSQAQSDKLKLHQLSCNLQKFASTRSRCIPCIFPCTRQTRDGFCVEVFLSSVRFLNIPAAVEAALELKQSSCLEGDTLTIPQRDIGGLKGHCTMSAITPLEYNDRLLTRFS